MEHFDKVIAIDQQPIGRTPRSNPATYTKVFDEIRSVFAQTREAKWRGIPLHVLVLTSRWTLRKCEGDGVIKVEMHFLADVFVPCEVCHGKRFNEQTLRVKYKGATIADVLNMSVREAFHHFEAFRKLIACCKHY